MFKDAEARIFYETNYSMKEVESCSLNQLSDKGSHHCINCSSQSAWKTVCGLFHSPIILFNLIVATEQFALGLHFIVDNDEIMDDVVHNPLTLGDWLNLAQFSIVWLCHLVL
ncbi:hypothetical protein F4818DRAFT_438137 [Hypoxylon cercidicola]|nr:hypothetical protein F4818DRAFT_438137 [Hypoxylon cercidicola]